MIAAPASPRTQGSKYADRMPIGLEGVIRGADPRTVRGLYKRLYQTSRMAAVIVGDIESAAALLATLEKEFASEPPLPAAERATSVLINKLGKLLMDQGKHEEALPLFREALEGQRKAKGDEDPDTLDSTANLGMLLSDLRRYDEAEPLLRESLKAQRKASGNEDPKTFAAVNKLGTEQPSDPYTWLSKHLAGVAAERKKK